MTGQDTRGITNRSTRAAQDREIVRLALPALGALVAEPLYLLTDSAVVGRLGTAQLAAVGLAGAVLTTAVSLCVFLAYGTTAVVARRLGAGDVAGALRFGVDGLWLGAAVGAVLALAGALVGPELLDLLGASPAVRPQAVAFLQVSLLGLPQMLLVLAATGVLRGLQDTRTPLRVAVVSAAANAALSALLVLVAGWGVRGSAAATVLAQTGAAVAYLVVLAGPLRAHGVGLRPDLMGVRYAGRSGLPLVARTATLRAALVGATAVAAHQGDRSLAAHHVVFQVWTLLALVLDAIAIAAQALTGRSLGARDVVLTRATTARMVQWGIVAGTALTVLVLATSRFVPVLFTSDPQVRHLMTAALVVAALLQPLAGLVFVLDGVLIGAGDNAYLARGGVVALGAFGVAAGVVVVTGAGLTALWLAIGVFMLARAGVLVHRARGDRWLVLGA